MSLLGSRELFGDSLPRHWYCGGGWFCFVLRGMPRNVWILDDENKKKITSRDLGTLRPIMNLNFYTFF